MEIILEVGFGERGKFGVSIMDRINRIIPVTLWGIPNTNADVMVIGRIAILDKENFSSHSKSSSSFVSLNLYHELVF